VEVGRRRSTPELQSTRSNMRLTGIAPPLASRSRWGRKRCQGNITHQNTTSGRPLLPFIFLSGSQVCLNLSCFFSWFPCLVLACLALLASPRLVCFPFLRQWPLWATRQACSPHGVNNARCSSPMASIRSRRRCGWHRGRWPSSPRITTHVDQLVDHASVSKLMSVMS
jgi:hypothetical protein